MRRDRVVLSGTFPARLEAADQLRAAVRQEGGNAEGLRSAAAAIDAASTRFSDAQIAVTHAAFAELLRILAQFVEWRAAVLEAAVDADRFLRAARLRLYSWRTDYGPRGEASALAPVVEALSAVDQPSAVGAVCERLATTPLPVGVDGDPPGPWGRQRLKDKEAETPPLAELSVAFLSFAVDGTAAASLDYLTPDESHDLAIEVRISRWPEGATRLRLAPVSIEVASSYELPTFEFRRPAGDPPHVVRQRSRARIHGGHALRAQPFEFRYAAEFAPQAAEQPVAVVGQRTLRFESVDLARSPFTGDLAVDQRLIEIRNTLRATHGVPQADLESTMSLAVGLARLTIRAVTDNIFPRAIPEAQFQVEARDELRRDPIIGPRLTVHAHAAAGISDLSLAGVPLELKVENQRVIALADCQAFVEQAAAYAVGASKKVTVLGVLNGPPRQAAAHPAVDGLGLLYAQSGLPVVTILIQGVLSRPSDLSR